MSDLIRLFLIFLVVFNPAGFTLLTLDLHPNPGDRRRRVLFLAAGLSLIVTSVAALLGEQLLDALDISTPSFQIATGVLLVLSALTVFLDDRRYSDAPTDEQGWTVARLVLWLASPGALAAAIAYAADRGVWTVILALFVALLATVSLAAIAASAIAGGSRRAVATWASRGLAAILVVIAIDLIRQGVENV